MQKTVDNTPYQHFFQERVTGMPLGIGLEEHHSRQLTPTIHLPGTSGNSVHSALSARAEDL
jgi:hypothetical protein